MISCWDSGKGSDKAGFLEIACFVALTFFLEHALLSSSPFREFGEVWRGQMQQQSEMSRGSGGPIDHLFNWRGNEVKIA